MQQRPNGSSSNSSACHACYACPTCLGDKRVTIQVRYDTFMPESCQSHPVVVKRDSEVTNVDTVDKDTSWHAIMGLKSSQQSSGVYAEATQ